MVDTEPLLTGKIILVSGGTQGVGAGIARAAAPPRCDGGRHRSPGRGGRGPRRRARRDRRRGLVLAADVADIPAAQGTVAATVERYGRVDGLVNAAGTTSRGTLLDTTEALFDNHIDVNLKAPFFLIQAAVADMKRRGEPGSIVNVITMSALGGQPYLAPYVASKAGLIGLTENAAHAHRWDKIRINGIKSAGPRPRAKIKSNGASTVRATTGSTRRTPHCRWESLGQVDDVAHLVILLLSEASGVVTGSIIDWDQKCREHTTDRHQGRRLTRKRRWVTSGDSTTAIRSRFSSARPASSNSRDPRAEQDRGQL
jgi:NAD(P)-dependent dehydrogenase (short-subunit alcohol dehydrogenase family)